MLRHSCSVPVAKRMQHSPDGPGCNIALTGQDAHATGWKAAACICWVSGRGQPFGLRVQHSPDGPGCNTHSCIRASNHWHMMPMRRGGEQRPASAGSKEMTPFRVENLGTLAENVRSLAENVRYIAETLWYPAENIKCLAEI
jgi:hypothetical protein